MSLAPGTHLGPYEILAAIGAGGMGEVHKARDTRLDRTVAIKVLPAQLADDPQFRDRFEREAKAIAALTHPHICTLYDVGRQDGTEYLVMEFLEGETLENRLKKGALPLDQALKTAIEIASALDMAHGAGIVHRDLKPGNVMLTKGGAKLLDFGLAKATAPVAVGAGLSMLPTTPPNLTAQGTILGTFQYMAPEQLEGQDADARTDIFAFGAVVYEMLTGKKAFTGKSQASLIGAILHAEPLAISTLQPLTPKAVDRIIRKCLAKDPASRWQTARDLLDELKWIAEGDVTVPPVVSSGRRAARLPWIVAAISLIVAAAAVATGVYFRRIVPDALVTRVDIVTPATTDPFSLALSPDGRQLAFIAAADGTSRLWVRPLDKATARPLAGTEAANYPFWSPDGRTIGFFADAKLKRVDLAGGTPQVLADAPAPRGGTWNHDGVILFAPGSGTELMRIAATGGTPSVVTHLTPGQGSHRWPQFLPGGRRFLFSVTLGQRQARGVWMGSLDGGAPTRLLPDDASAAYAPPGYLLLVSQGVLSAHSFDPARGLASAEGISLAQEVGADPATSLGGFSVSETGVLAYRSGTGARRQLVWIDRTGRALGVLDGPDDALPVDPELTVDGRRLAVGRTVEGDLDVWWFDLARRTRDRFTSDPSVDTQPIWSPDGTRIVFRSSRNGRFDLFEKPANGAADEQPLLVTALDKAPQDWSSDGRLLLYSVSDPKTRSDLWALPLTGERKPFPVLQTVFDEVQGQFSPDGRWLAYASNDTGRYEIYVRPFPGPGGKSPVSTGGGVYPRWRRDGRELFYVASDNKLMAVPIQVTSDTRTLNPGAPVALFSTRLATGSNIIVGGYNSGPQYAVSPDGRFLMNVMADEIAPSPITLVLNWSAELKRLVPTK